MEKWKNKMFLRTNRAFVLFLINYNKARTKAMMMMMKKIIIIYFSMLLFVEIWRDLESVV